MTTTHDRLVSGLSALALAAAAALAGLTATAAPAVAVTDGTTSGPGDAVTVTKTVSRTYYKAGESDPTVDSNQVSVTLAKHTQVQSRERIHITWTGAHPTGGRSANPYGETGQNQEYPLLILQCRGTVQTVSPSTCWTGTSGQRTARASNSSALWRHDLLATDAQKARISGLTEDQVPDDCSPIFPSTSWHYTPFVTQQGKTFSACDNDHMPPEAASGSVDPPNEINGFTAKDGSGVADFEVRTVTENESLGCSYRVACSIVAIPIMGVSCADEDAYCNGVGAYGPGTSADPSIGTEPAVTSRYWWSASNWANRMVFPITIAQPPGVCSIITTKKAVPFYGSELLSQAALQWTPAYCLNESRFNWQSNSMPDDAAFTLMKGGYAPAAEVAAKGENDTGIAYAPTAVSGFAIAFNIDKPDNAGQQTSLNLNARLLAKLLTESYPGSAIGARRPGIGDNPKSLNMDPEFQKLNPGLDDEHFSEAASTLMALSTSSQVIEQLTAYLAADPEAAAFLDGVPDPWGMTVNPAYRTGGSFDVPVSTWPLLDTWTPQNLGQECLDQNPAPYLPKIAAPVNNFRLISMAMLFNWPNVNTACNKDISTGLWKLGRVEPQGVGNRFMLGLVTLADARRYGLSVAKLQSSYGHYVAPDNKGLSAALATATSSGDMQPFVMKAKTLRHTDAAYPGTMVVYTAVKTSGMAVEDAQNVAQFLQVSSTEGQRPGRGVGQLPEGYLPIVDSGVTKPLYASAVAVRQAVEKQAVVVKPPKSTPTPTTGPTSAPSIPPIVAPTVPALTAPSAGDVPPAPAPSVPAATTPAVQTAASVQTAAMTSGVGGALLPLLLVGGILAGLLTTAGRIYLRVRGVR